MVKKCEEHRVKFIAKPITQQKLKNLLKAYLKAK
jgi:homospermidine synthase